LTLYRGTGFRLDSEKLSTMTGRARRAQMKDSEPAGISPTLRWIFFLILLAVAMGWAAKSVLARSAWMKTADTSARAFSTTKAGTKIKAVARIDVVTSSNLKAVLLERVSDSVYRRPRADGSTITAVLTPETAVVMGKVQDVIPGAIVQLAGTVDNDHVLHASQLVILTGNVHLADDSK
jgi:hypothetical protein